MISSFHFASSRFQEQRAETRLKALKVAKEKAEAMAAAVGAKLGQVLTIEERGTGGLLITSNVIEPQPRADQSSGTFVPGALSVQVTVYESFALE